MNAFLNLLRFFKRKEPTVPVILLHGRESLNPDVVSRAARHISDGVGREVSVVPVEGFERVSRLNLKEGDTLVLETSEVMSDGQYRNTVNLLREHLQDDLRVLILDRGLKVTGMFRG